VKRAVKETEASGVRIEGGEPMAKTITRLLEVGIPVMGHLGLTPQPINRFGSYAVRATRAKEADHLYKDARHLDRLGIFSLVLEKIPASLAK
jgi:3-methyl-2-oxobutanoate hydroxymethyltransferase